MTKLSDVRERQAVGTSFGMTTSGLTGTASQQLLADPKGDGPATFRIVADDDVYVRQGPERFSPTTNEFLLKKNYPLDITVQSDVVGEEDNWLHARRPGATNVDIRITHISSRTPGAPASTASTGGGGGGINPGDDSQIA